MKNVSDEEILDFIGNNTHFEKGFRLLMYKYQERLYWHIRRMVHEHDDANDVIQNTFIKVYKSIHRFEAKSKLYTWLYKIATNESITFLGKRNRQQTASIDNEMNNLKNSLTTDSYFDENRATQKLNQAIALLPEKQRIVFNLRYYDEMSYQEISDVLNVTTGALKANYHHAVKKIESYLKQVGVE